jgi:hypothetical protein
VDGSWSSYRQSVEWHYYGGHVERAVSFTGAVISVLQKLYEKLSSLVNFQLDWTVLTLLYMKMYRVNLNSVNGKYFIRDFDASTEIYMSSCNWGDAAFSVVRWRWRIPPQKCVCKFSNRRRCLLSSKYFCLIWLEKTLQENFVRNKIYIKFEHTFYQQRILIFFWMCPRQISEK